MTTFDKRLDEILQVMFNSTRPNVALPKAKAAITSLVLKDVIGEDDHYMGQVPPSKGVFDDIDNRNRLRYEQRSIITKELK